MQFSLSLSESQPLPSISELPSPERIAELLSAFPAEPWKLLSLDSTCVTLASPLVSLDVEHDEQGGFVGLGIYDGHTAYYFSSVRAASCLDFRSLRIIAHNGRGDMECLKMWGFPVEDQQLVWDTMLVGHILDSSLKDYGLKGMAERELNVSYPSYEDIVGKRTAKSRITLDKWPVQLVARYNAMDCYVTWKLYERQKAQRDVSGYFHQIELPASKVFYSMETRGTRVNLAHLNTLKDALEAELAPVEKAIKDTLKIENVNSDRQVVAALASCGIRPTLKGKPSRSKTALERFRGNPAVDLLFKHSELTTLLDMFVYKYLERDTEIVNPFFNQCGTRTGRPSCSNPNLLQIPRRTKNGQLVREMFIPRDGFSMGDADFGQIEPRVLAHLSGDRALCQMFTSGIDFHEYTGTRLSIDRERAKILNLSVGYRATSASVSQQLKCSDKEAQIQIDQWWEMFPDLWNWEESLIQKARHQGYITTLMGRRIKVDGLTDTSSFVRRDTGKRVFPRREAAERQVINNIAQASAAEIMKLGMINVHNAGITLLAQVYDELLWESPVSQIDQDVQTVRTLMEGCIKLDVPLVVDANKGVNWQMAKKPPKASGKH